MAKTNLPVAVHPFLDRVEHSLLLRRPQPGHGPEVMK